MAEGPQKIYASIGQRSCSQLLVELTAEQLETRHPRILPNVKIYANPLTNQILMAGHIGIESELVDADYPTFLVFNKTWEKMMEDFYGGEREKPKAESMKTSPEQEIMMVTSIEDLNITNLISDPKTLT